MGCVQLAGWSCPVVSCLRDHILNSSSGQTKHPPSTMASRNKARMLLCACCCKKMYVVERVGSSYSSSSTVKVRRQSHDTWVGTNLVLISAFVLGGVLRLDYTNLRDMESPLRFDYCRCLCEYTRRTCNNQRKQYPLLLSVYSLHGGLVSAPIAVGPFRARVYEMQICSRTY